jgi:hydroxymethylpyrimidine pyrophosphatase-like HAD family hydrolase
MKSRRIAFCDLDDMLFQSRRKSDGDDLTPVVFQSNGTPISFQTRQQRALFQLLSATTRLIPTTGRGTKWMQRVKLPFSDYAICSFGAVILTPQGTPDPGWHHLISKQVEQCNQGLTFYRDLAAAESRRLCIDVRMNTAVDQGLELYVTVKHRQRNAEELAQLAVAIESVLQQGWWLHVNGRNMAICPPFLAKEKAVAYFLSELAGPHDLVLGLGDSLSDVGFMSACDFAVSPVNSQIFSSLSVEAAEQHGA